jgi:hypothetical protein
MKATLVWTDPPASLASGMALVNNVDLVVTDQVGNIYFSNGRGVRVFSTLVIALSVFLSH